MIVVNTPPGFPLTTLRRPETGGGPSNLIYDAERQALFFIDPQNHRILRYAFSDGWSGTSVTLGGVTSIALSPDGTELVEAGLPGSIVRLDPVTLATLSLVNFPSPFGLDTIAFANDGSTIGTAQGTAEIVRYDMLAQQVVTPVLWSEGTSRRRIFASADGDTLILALYGDFWSRDRRIYVHDASPPALSSAAWRVRPPTTSFPSALSMSRNASRIIMVNDTPGETAITVYDADFNALGTLPWRASALVLSPDGNFAYAYYPPQGSLRKFDLSVPGSVTEIGAGTVLAPANTSMFEMTISPDGGTLFLAGPTSVVISPAP
jgi:hypothetical protein